MVTFPPEMLPAPDPGDSTEIVVCNGQCCAENEQLRAENERLLRGIAGIRDYLNQNRIGDATFDCDALLCGSAHE